MVRVTMNGIHARNPKSSFENPGIVTAMKNKLNSGQNPMAGKDQRGKFFIHPIQNNPNMPITEAINENHKIADGTSKPELKNIHVNPNNPKGMVAGKDMRDENAVSIFNNFKVCNSMDFILEPGSWRTANSNDLSKEIPRDMFCSIMQQR